MRETKREIYKNLIGMAKYEYSGKIFNSGSQPLFRGAHVFLEQFLSAN